MNSSWGAIVTFQSYSPVLTDGSVATFEGFSEFTRITNQYAALGMTFSQTGGGAPMIDNFNQNGGANGCSGLAWCFGYGASSGSGVLTGSPDGGNVVTTAGIIVTFTDLQTDVQAFLSDTAPLGNYTVSAFNASHTLLASLTVLQANTLPLAYSGGVFPPPGTFPLPGIFVGFQDTSAEIKSIQIGPSSAAPGSDAFAVDDIRISAATPEPGSLLLIGTGLVLVAGRFFRR
jgi:hypothetical protein